MFNGSWKFIKKYWVVLILGILTGACISWVAIAFFNGILRKNFGSLADWLSGVGSLLAIAFAYWQIYEQRKEFEINKKADEDLEKQKLRPFFSIHFRSKIFQDKENYYVNEKDTDKFSVSKKDNKEEAIFLNGKEGYEVTNIINNVALNVTFEVIYQDNERDILNVDSLQAKATGIFFTKKVLNYPVNNSTNVMKNVEDQTKCIRIYFDSLLGIHYCQEWKEKIKKGESVCTNFKASNIFEVDAKEIPLSTEGTVYMGNPF